MADEKFINEAFHYALTLYDKSKVRPYSPHFNSFLVIVIRALCEIYGEGDIMNSFSSKNEASFDNNLKRFGYPDEKIANFKAHMQGFFNWAKTATPGEVVKVKSIDFILIQEDLIDMMIRKMRKIDVSEESSGAFINLLYTKDNPDPRFKLFSMQVADDQDRVANYLKNELFKKDNDYSFELVKDNVLEPKFYDILGLTPYDITNMSQEELNNANMDVLNYIQVDVSEISDKERLDKALDAYLNPKNPLTSGSGFVDGILLASILTTLAVSAFIVSVLFTR